MLNEYKYFLLIIVLNSLIENSNAIDESYDQYMARIEYHSSRLSWDGALKTCKDKGSYIVTPYSEMEAKYLVKRAPNENLWIGLSKKNSSTATYLNGCVTDPQYSNFASNQPNGGVDNEKCIEMYPTGQWNDKSCSELRPFFCYQKPQIYLGDSGTSYANAIKSCDKLWTARSWYDAEYAASLAYGANFWIGSKRSTSTESFLTPQSVKSEFTWNIQSQIGCPYYNMFIRLGVWSDCWQESYYFCEITPTTKIPSNKPTIAIINESYDQYMDRVEYHSSKLSWNDANKTCQAKGSYIVTPYSDTEAKYLLKKAPNENIWIGLTKKHSSKWPTYLNGFLTAWQYFNFALNQPDGGSDNKKCFEMDPSAQWNDRSCEQLRPFYCYRKPEIILSSETLSYADAIKSCNQKLWTARSWYDVLFAASLANGKEFWTGSQRHAIQEPFYTPLAVKSEFKWNIFSKTGCTYCTKNKMFFKKDDCNEKLYFFCDFTSPTKKPTQNPTLDPYQKPLILPIETRNVTAGSLVTITIHTKQLQDPKQSYGNIIWSIESLRNKSMDEWISLFSLPNSQTDPVLLVIPSDDLIGNYWVLVKATNPSGKVDSYPVIINVIPKQNQ